MCANVLKIKYKNQIYISIHTPESLLCRNTFWLSLRDFHTWIVQHLPIILLKILQALPNWLWIIAREPFSDLAIDFQVGRGVVNCARN
jgi:hypothetical protein